MIQVENIKILDKFNKILYIILGGEVMANMISTVTVRGQTAIPVYIRKQYNIKPETLLEWIDDGHGITVVPISKDPIKSLKGRYKRSHFLKALLKSRKEER